MAEADKVRSLLDQQVSFHSVWRRRTMLFYATVTLGGLLASMAATIVAATHGDTLAASLAAAGALFYGVERAFYLRERWRLHVRQMSGLLAIRADLDVGLTNDRELAARLSNIMRDYAESMPFGPREPGPAA